MKTSARARILLSLAVIIIVTSVCLPSIFSNVDGQQQQQLLQTIKKRNLTIELDRQQQILTKGQLTVPAVAEGPFPAVLLIHGSGAADMDGYIPPNYLEQKLEQEYFCKLQSIYLKEGSLF